MSIFKKWFKENPSKILGDVVVTKDWRNKDRDVEVVVGELDRIESIDVVDSFVPKKGLGVAVLKEKSVSSDMQERNVLKALDAFEEKRQKKSSSSSVKRGSAQKIENIRFFYPDPNAELISFSEGLKLMNKGLNVGYIKAWVFYKKSNNFPLNEAYDEYYDSSENYLREALSNGFLCFDPVEGFLPSVLYYSGNIYSRIKALDNAGEIAEITREQKRAQYQRLKEVLPEKLVLTESASLRLNVNWQSLFAKKIKFEYLGEEKSLYDAFWDYIYHLEASDFKYFKKGRASLMWRHIYHNENIRGETDKWKQEFYRQSALELDHQMYLFLTEKIDPNVARRIERIWNEEHNGFVEPNYDLIPVGFVHNKYFKDAPLMIKDAQIEGVSFMDISGNGILAYDVGVGKTMTAILAAANALANGQCKRPVIAVPNSTYWKWLAEIRGIYDEEGNVISHGLLPQYKINSFYNLGADVLKDIWNPETGLNEPISENSITLITYEGLEKLGFSEAVGNQFISEVGDIIGQTQGRSTRDRNKDYERAVEMVSRAEKGAVVYIDQAQFDYFVLDEAHNCNKLFRQVENSDESSKESGKVYKIMHSGTLPIKAAKAFFLSRWVQKASGGRNICLLTATPFNNSPLEVYSILALADLDKMKRMGLGNIRTFFDEYIFTTYEKVVKAGNRIETKQVVKGWNNKVSLQSVMFSIMNYKSGADANIVRPIKHVFPKISEVLDNGSVIPLPPEKQIKTYLFPTERQARNFKLLDAWYKSAKKSREFSAGADLVLITRGMSNTFSPDAYKYNDGTDTAESKGVVSGIDPIDLIEDSAKLKYTMECIKSIVAHHKKNNTPIGGIVIYSNVGISLFPLIKQYLEDEIGFSKKGYQPAKKWFGEVEIIASGISSDDKEAIKEGFLSGKIKVIIGSSTIREGIDLQKRATTIFNLYNEWNPTGYKQLEGRIWRQGNIYKNVRIVTPLLIDSSDAMVWQKLEEKTARINDIFDRNDRTNILDVIEEDREAIKWSIMQDTEKIAEEMISEQVEELKGDIEQLKSYLSTVRYMETDKKNADYYLATITRKANRYSSFVKGVENDDVVEMLAYLKKNKSSIKDLINDWHTGMDFDRDMKEAGSEIRGYYHSKDKYSRAVDSIIAKYGEDFIDKKDIVLDNLAQEIKALEEGELVRIKSTEHKEQLILKLNEERAALKAGADSFEATVAAFAATNYLLDEMAKKPETKEQKNEKKKKDYTDAIEGLYLLLSVAPEHQKKEYLDAIEGLELLLTTL